MRNEKMELVLVPSSSMDEAAKQNQSEHGRIRMSRRARIHYSPSDWASIYLQVHGQLKDLKLRIAKARAADIKKQGAQSAKRIGFVTTQTYLALMGKQAAQNKKSIWISEPSERLTIGCDPEFVLTEENGAPVYADTAFNDKWAQLGSDGPCAELRPNASNNVDELVRNIENLLKTRAGPIQRYRWVGGATYQHLNDARRYAIGGHIHLGMPRLANINDNFVPLQRRVVRILDELVALPMVRIDTPLPEMRRGPLHYGRFEDMRSESFKLEWRVPSGIWLVHKELAHAVLSTTKAVAEEVWKRYSDHDCKKEFMLETTQADNLEKSFDCLSGEKVRELVNGAKASDVGTDLVHAVHARLKKMSTYCIYKEEIDQFIKLCCSTKMPLTVDKLELRHSWINNKPI